MNFTSILVVYIWNFLIGAALSTPSSEDHVHDVLLTPKNQIKPHSHIPSQTYRRTDQLSEQEREERINRGIARMMQLITFLGHFDNFITDKVKTVTRTLHQAMTSDDEEELPEGYYDRRRQARSRISTTITSESA